MASKEFVKLVVQIAQRIVDAPDNFSPSQRNEEWTKINFVLPLLEGLGWDQFNDISYEDSPEEIEGLLDFVLKCNMAIGIEAKALDVNHPRDRNHPAIKKGLKQSKDRNASYFIWTNGDCWQFFSLSMFDAPIYEVKLSNAHGNVGKIEEIASEFEIIDKKLFSANPTIFNERIRDKWKKVALPAAFDVLLKERPQDLIQHIREDLPNELDIIDDEILTFVKSLKPKISTTEPISRRTRKSEKDHSFPNDWHSLLDSYEPEYERARARFRKAYYSKLGHYLISDKYGPWSKSTTWRHVGIRNDPNERKKLGPVISLFREWHFIEDGEGIDMYKRVEDSVPYLTKLLDKTLE